MTTAYTSLLGLALPVTGELSGTWGDTVNNAITSLLDSAVAGTTNISTDGDVTLTTTTGAANQAREAILLFSGARTALRTVTAPAQSKIYTVINATTGGYAVKLVGSGPTTGVTIANGSSTTVAWNGSDFVEVSSPSSIILPNGTANGVLYLNGSKVVTSGSALTFDGTTLTNANTIKVQTSAGTAPKFWIGQAATSAWSIGSPASADALVFVDEQFSSEKMRLTSTGLGIGTSSPAKRLDVRQAYTADTVVAQIGNTNNGNGATPVATLFDFTVNNGTPVSRIGSVYTQALGQAYLSFSTYGSGSLAERMVLDSSGHLGLGVTPSASWASGRPVMQIGSAMGLDCNNPSQAIMSANRVAGASQDLYINSNYATSYMQLNGVHAWYNAPSGTAGNAITFTQAMTLDASGRLGIGVTSPQQRLDIAGAIRLTPNTADTAYSADIFANYDSAHPFQINVKNNGSSAEYMGVYADGGGANNRVVFPTGNVGIGTTAPATKLELAANPGPTIRLSNTETSAQPNDVIGTLEYYSFDGDGAHVGAYVKAIQDPVDIYGRATALTFGTNPVNVAVSERMRISADGDLLVGTTTGGAKICVDGSASVSSRVASFRSRTAGDTAYACGLFSKYTNDNSTSQVFIQFSINNDTVTNGQINGNGANQVAFGSWSDSRLKENIVDLPSQLSNIMALRPVEFDYIESEGGGHQIGFIAQEMETVFPDAIGERSDGMKILTGWSKTEARLVKAIQEQQAIIESLKARLDAANL